MEVEGGPVQVWNNTNKPVERFEVFHQTSLRRILRIKFYWSTFPTKRFSGEPALSRSKPSSVLPDCDGIVKMPDCRLPKFLLDRKRSGGRSRKNWKACALYWRMQLVATFAGVSDIDMEAVHIESSEDA